MALVLEIKKTLEEHMLLDGTKNRLAAIFIFVAMGQYHIHYKPTMSAITQLVIALASELGVTKVASQKEV